jgi:hypothetical protein
VLVFVATSKSSFWLGPADPHVIAEQVVTSSGPSGHNVEYVLRLAEWVHSTLPSVHDDHLFSIEVHVKLKVKERNLCLKTLMGEKEKVVESLRVNQSSNRPTAVRRGFRNTCETKCLKCIKL